MDALKRHICWSLDAMQFPVSADAIARNLWNNSNLPMSLITEERVEMELKRIQGVKKQDLFGLPVYSL